MSDRINDGGPVFPLENAGTEFRTGMSLRDWFAGRAIGALLTASLQPDDLVGIDYRPNTNEADMAREAYRVADALLAARQGGDA